MKSTEKLFRNAGGFVVLVALVLAGTASAQDDPYAEPDEPGLPPSNMVLDLPRTAIVITDPQIDFLSPDGVTWGLVGNSRLWLPVGRVPDMRNQSLERPSRLCRTANGRSGRKYRVDLQRLSEVRTRF